jgi:hypothetical protein
MDYYILLMIIFSIIIRIPQSFWNPVILLFKLVFWSFIATFIIGFIMQLIYHFSLFIENQVNKLFILMGIN